MDAGSRPTWSALVGLKRHLVPDDGPQLYIQRQGAPSMVENSPRNRDVVDHRLVWADVGGARNRIVWRVGGSICKCAWVRRNCGHGVEGPPSSGRTLVCGCGICRSLLLGPRR